MDNEGSPGRRLAGDVATQSVMITVLAACVVLVLAGLLITRR